MERELTFEERLNRFVEANEKGFAEIRERQEKIDQGWVKLQEQMEGVGDKLKELGETIGGVSENIGHHAEQYFQEALGRTLKFGGEKYDKMLPNLKPRGKDRENCEFDMLMVNGNAVALIEAKNRIHPKFVKDMVEKKAVQFRRYFPEYENYKLYLGIAGFSYDESVVREAKEYGIGILRQEGDTAVESGTEDLKAY